MRIHVSTIVEELFRGGECGAMETDVSTSEIPQGELYTGVPYLQFEEGQAFPVGMSCHSLHPIFDKLSN